ncbi:MAG: hypothetical protein AB8G17_04760 [Gammaproteobacteria bacterium]
MLVIVVKVAAIGIGGLVAKRSALQNAGAGISMYAIWSVSQNL